MVGLALLASALFLTEWLGVLGLTAWMAAVLVNVALMKRLLLHSRAAAVPGIK